MLGAPFVSWAGSPWPPSDQGWAWIVGLAGVSYLALEIWLARRTAADRSSDWRLPLLLIASFGVGVAALTGLGRGVAGPANGFTSRYLTLTAPFALVVSTLALQRAVARRRYWLAWTGLLAVAASALAGSALRLFEFPRHRDLLARASRALLQGGPERQLRILHPRVEQVLGGRPILQRHRLSVFRPGSSVAPITAAPSALEHYEQGLEWPQPPPARLAVGAQYRLPLRIENPSPVPWPTLGVNYFEGAVRLSYHWVAWDGTVSEGPRTDFSRDIGPGERAAVAMCLRAPSRPGRYQLRVSLVQESVVWFEDRGAPGLEAAVEVRAAPAARALAQLLHGLGTLRGSSYCPG
jgi:hypothetical protein